MENFEIQGIGGNQHLWSFSQKQLKQYAFSHLGQSVHPFVVGLYSRHLSKDEIFGSREMVRVIGNETAFVEAVLNKRLEVISAQNPMHLQSEFESIISLTDLVVYFSDKL